MSALVSYVLLHKIPEPSKIKRSNKTMSSVVSASKLNAKQTPGKIGRCACHKSEDELESAEGYYSGLNVTSSGAVREGQDTRTCTHTPHNTQAVHMPVFLPWVDVSQ